MKKVPYILLLLLAFGVRGQTILKLDGNSELSVSGTSTLHDWTIVAEELSGKAKFEITDGTLLSVSELSIKVKTTEIKSGKSGMDNNTFKALKSDKHPYITFALSAAGATKSGSKYVIKSAGNLSVAGVTKPVVFTATCVLNANSVGCEGSYAMKMTDFDVEPPTAMFGTIKTGNEITIDFNVKFENSELSKL
jgi:polyisoprenoid-binding protein YceI